LLLHNDFVSSISSTGNHRTLNENEKKNTLTQTAFGGNISFNKNSFHFGLNGLAFKFSVPLIRKIQPYNQYAVQGDEWHNYSADYSYTFRNFHFFSEAALDKRKSKAFVGGVIASLDPKVDASLVYRNISETYQALYGNAFTEGTSPTNEKGAFMGLSIKPSPYFKIDAYTDVFSFPWLRFRVDAPSKGSEYLLQITYKVGKKFELYTRLKNENKAINISSLDLPTTPIYTRPRFNFRVQSNYLVSRVFSLEQRLEKLWFDPNEKDRRQQGFMSYIAAKYKSAHKPFSANARLQYFKTDSSDSRIYSFENDVLYSYSIPQFIGKGFRYYLNLNYDLSNNLSLWFRWAQTIYFDKTKIASGLDEISGNKRSEIKFQVLIKL